MEILLEYFVFAFFISCQLSAGNLFKGFFNGFWFLMPLSVNTADAYHLIALP